MTQSEYNIIAILSFVAPIVLMLSADKYERSTLGFLILYGINFLIILFVFWLTKNIF